MVDSQMASLSGVLMSYASEDQERVEPLAQYLYDKGFVVWFDMEGASIPEALDEAGCVVVVWTINSVHSQSVHQEAFRGKSQGILVPLLLDAKAQIPEEFRDFPSLNLTDWDGTEGTELRRLTDRVRSLVEQGPAGRVLELSDDWRISSAQYAVSELRDLTSRIPHSISTILIQDSEAAKELRGALKQVSDTYKVVNDAIRDFITACLKQPIDHQPLVEIQRDTLRKAIEDGRGHCGFIRVHYRKIGGLRQRIKDQLSPEEMQQADEIFERLSTADNDLFASLAKIGDVLKEQSGILVRLLAQEQEAYARKLGLKILDKLRPLEDQLSNAMQDLQGLERSLGYAEPV